MKLNTSLTMPMPGTMGSAKIVMTDNTKTKIGIIGLGFVGGAINNSIEDFLVQKVLIDPHKGYSDTYDQLTDTDGVFVCVPSPMRDDGTCDTSFLEDVISKLKVANFQGVIISKCTIPPSTYEALAKDTPNLVHAPEFLTAANANMDYISGKFAFIGGTVKAYMNEAERLIRITQPHLEDIIFCKIGEASLAKYTINSFLATKVAFMNEIYEIAEASGLDYNKIAYMITADKRIGQSHMRVPGPDGSFGFGGACFPKDTSALLKYAESIGQTPMVLDAAVKKNTLLRLK